MVAKWRTRAKNARIRCDFERAEAINECADELEDAKPSDLLCPTPEVRGLIPVVLYLQDQKDVDELIKAFKIAKPNAIAKPL